MNRIKWIDIFKGCGIILIVLGHVLRTGVFRNIVYYFHVPAFFFISGITTKDKPLNRTYIWSQFKRLMIPYYFFGIVSIAVYAVLGELVAKGFDMSNTQGVVANLKALLYGSSILSFNAPLWFLPALFVTKLLYQSLCTLLRGNKKLLFIFAILACFAAYIYTNANLFALPFSLELVFKLFPFFLAGQICAPLLIDMESKATARWKFLLAALCVLPMTCVAAAFAPPINYTNNQISNPIVFYGIASVGCIALFYLSIGVQHIRWLDFIGRKTMPILVMHKFPIVFFQVIAPFSELLKKTDTVTGIFSAILVSAITLFLCIIVGLAFEKFCPILLGTQQKNSKGQAKQALVCDE